LIRKRQPPSPHCSRLRKLAEAYARELARREPCAIAATGSTARGDSVAGSDIDLWVIGDQSGRFPVTGRSVPITLLRQRLDEALELDNLCIYEVDDVWVIHDPDGVFERIRTRFAKHRPKIRQIIRRATQEDVRAHLDEACHGAGVRRTIHLGRVAFILGAWELFSAFGWRVPKFRNLRAHLPARSLVLVKQLLRLRSSPESRRWVLHALPRLLAESRATFQRWNVERLDFPTQAVEQLRQGPVEDGLLLLRAHFHEQWQPLLQPSQDLSAWPYLPVAELPRNLGRYYRIIHGLEGSTLEVAESCKLLLDLQRSLPSAATLIGRAELSRALRRVVSV
jgi:hypothetical protein